MTNHTKAALFVTGMIGFGAACAVAVWGGLIYLLGHFIAKFW